jgi:protein-tyrosine phosphatase
MKAILFVCLGNICRSPLCEGFAKDYTHKNNINFTIDSAGISSYHIRETPCNLSQKIAEKYNIDISQQHSRQITQEDFKKFDYIVALDKKNYSDLKEMGCSNLYLLGNYGYDGQDVPDPYYYEDTIEVVWEMVTTCVTNLIEEVLKTN